MSKLKDGENQALRNIQNPPKADLFVINVAFSQIQDPAARQYLNQLPTSFSLTDQQVDDLRAAASAILLNSSEFQRLTKELNATVIEGPK
ncbi:hypothetical protein [Polynucleobacter brandtiae]|uniref:hypothetical protein n=1 Tax=Polynucleobacter brandtiae TaxID=1938816 RepID=UPI000C24B6CC|nr:hypothetical protein [Polynucleobacter brandtiae]